MRRNSGLHTGRGKYNHTKRRSTGFSPASKHDKRGGKGEEKKKEKNQETMIRREIMLKYVPNINPGQ